MAEVAHIMCMNNMPPDNDTPTYEGSLCTANQEGGSLAGTDVKINDQENRFIRLAWGGFQSGPHSKRSFSQTIVLKHPLGQCCNNTSPLHNIITLFFSANLFNVFVFCLHIITHHVGDALKPACVCGWRGDENVSANCRYVRICWCHWLCRFQTTTTDVFGEKNLRL